MVTQFGLHLFLGDERLDESREREAQHESPECLPEHEETFAQASSNIVKETREGEGCDELSVHYLTPSQLANGKAAREEGHLTEPVDLFHERTNLRMAS